MGITPLTSLYSWWIRPRARHEDDRRREYLLNVVLSASIVMLTIMDGFVAYYSFSDGVQYNEISFATFSALLIFFVVLMLLSRRGFFVIASYLLVLAYGISVSYAAFRWGANLPVALLSYALVILLSSILISTRFGFISFGAIATFMLILWATERAGVHHPQIQIVRDADGIVFAILLAFVTIVAWLSNREIEKSLARARRSEAELRKERDLLEVKVEERTRELHDAQLEKFADLYRFAEFGELASGLFHDTLNLLNIALLEARPGSPLIEGADNIQNQIERFRISVRKQLSKDDTQEYFSLAESVGHVIQLLSYQAKKSHIRINFDRDFGDACEYFGSPFKFHQVVMNLMSNAIQSFDSVREIHTNQTVTIRLFRKGKSYIVCVEDNGIGISEAILDKIFEPFFTTKSHGKGTGIGLAMTKRIVEKDLQGTITVTSKQGRGSIFTVQFPKEGGTTDTKHNSMGNRDNQEGAR